jgi:hypothetical protein
VAGVESSEQVHYLGATDLAHHQAVGAHSQRLPDEVAQGDFPRTFDVGWASFQPDHMWMVGIELARVLDQDKTFGGIGQRQQGIEKGRLARAGATADQEGDASVQEISEYGGSDGGEGAGGDQVLEGEDLPGRHPQGQACPGRRDR